MEGKYVVVRTYNAGVHVGVLANRAGQEVVLTDARRVWNWQGRNTLHEIALRGVGSGSRVSEAVPSVLLTASPCVSSSSRPSASATSCTPTTACCAEPTLAAGASDAGQPVAMSTTNRVGPVSVLTLKGRSRSRTPMKLWP